ncbi:hypothetical protein GE09DRAFT_1062544 [Coniochaeta sp. 2T2.1]|nr:hypothetical protein GE09DRAFT_1062544 [Coniochaeta sp. 2T2.1]
MSASRRGKVEDYDGSEDAITPVIVLDETDVQPPREHLTAKIETLIDDDDVCSTDFIRHIVVKPRLDLKGTTQKENRNEKALSTLSLLSHINGEECRIERRVTLLQETSHDAKLASGPYFLHGRNLHAAFRLYPDDQDAFICGMIPTSIRSPLSFLLTSLFVKPSSTPIKYIPVPSRHLYASAEPPRGTRMALNDNYQLEDITTTRSSRAFVEYHDAGNMCPEEYEECKLLLNLVKLGAAFVGKTKTTFFSSGAQWVDFPSPINPRGDSYQEALGSSAGAATALAAYGWLDFAIGGDFSANGRDSVACHGLFGVRLSQSKGIPLGVTCNRCITSLASTTNSVGHHPTSGGIEKTEFDFEERWAQSHKDRGLKSFIAQTPYLLTIWAEWNTHKTFVTDYTEKFKRRPFIEQPTRSRVRGTKGLDAEMLAPLLGTPQVIVPFAQQPYTSDATGNFTVLPLCASVIGPHGSDVMLLELVEKALISAKWPTEVRVGADAFFFTEDNARYVEILKPSPLLEKAGPFDDTQPGEMFVDPGPAEAEDLGYLAKATTLPPPRTYPSHSSSPPPPPPLPKLLKLFFNLNPSPLLLKLITLGRLDTACRDSSPPAYGASKKL